MINNSVQISKSGGPIAAAWAVLNYVGYDGYLELAIMNVFSIAIIGACVSGDERCFERRWFRYALHDQAR